MAICKRINSIEGTWTYADMIGSIVTLRSLQCGNYFRFLESSSQDLTLEEIYFRVTLDGKISPVFKVKEFPDRLFSVRDMELVEINQVPSVKSICGEFLCGQAICGYDVSHDPSFDEIEGGLAVIDDSGNIITNRYIRFKDSTVEDPRTDKDQITDIDINFSGNVLD